MVLLTVIELNEKARERGKKQEVVRPHKMWGFEHVDMSYKCTYKYPTQLIMLPHTLDKAGIPKLSSIHHRSTCPIQTTHDLNAGLINQDIYNVSKMM